jgi:hypothetical protein
MVLANDLWQIEFGGPEAPGPLKVRDLRSNRLIADAPYCYSIEVDTNGNRDKSTGFAEWSIESVSDARGQSVILTGRFDFGKLGPTDIGVRHRLTLPSNTPWFEEQIELTHTFGPDVHQIENIRFGFRKRLYDRNEQDWVDGADRFTLHSVPHRRRLGHSIDRKNDHFTVSDLFPQSWDPDLFQPGYGSEGWIWTDDETGVLIAKYNRDAIEFSIYDGEFVLDEAGALDVMDAVHSHVPMPVHVAARFGGVGLYRGDPEIGQHMQPRTDITFGVTRIQSFDGDWQVGYRAFKEMLRASGHATPVGFDPPLHWNELYNLGWRLGDNAPLQTLDQLKTEARIAADVGAEALYLDPTWDTSEGTTIWDADRLGPQAAFTQFLNDECGLKLSLHLMMHTTALDEDDRFYLKDIDGNRRSWGKHETEIYQRRCVCCASDYWIEEKTRRLRELGDNGATFFMFDFLSYAKDAANKLNTHGFEIQCHAPDHGHPVPLTRQQHADGVNTVIKAIKDTHPQIIIEAHDRISGGMQDYHPLYFQHGYPNSFDENWGFEYMWDPYYDLISGQALSLYEYNLAYDIPLYLHIHEGRDTETMLAFWWYASTCRHLGIGGVSNPEKPLYQALKNAVRIWRDLKPFFTQGDFQGTDELSHLHVLEDRNQAVAVLFNMGGAAEDRTIELDLCRLAGLASIDSVDGAELTARDGNRITLSTTVDALSPRLVGININLP